MLPTELLTFMLNIAPFFLLLLVVYAVFQLWNRHIAGFVATSIFIVLGAVGIIFAPRLLGLTENVADSAGATPTPTVAPEPLPSSEPLAGTGGEDLTSLWIALGILGGFLIVAILAVMLFMVLGKARRSSLELRRKAEREAADRAKAVAIWNRSVDRHRALKDKVLEVETDWTMLFSYPALVDASIPQTRDFHRALQRADNASAEPPAELSLSMDIGAMPYPKLVEDAQGAWNAAWSFAQHTGTKLIPRGERKKIDQILKLLKLAQSGGGTEAERSVAYSRVEKLVSELQFVKVPERAMKSIDAEKRLMIEGGATVAVAEESASSERQPIPVQAR